MSVRTMRGDEITEASVLGRFVHITETLPKSETDYLLRVHEIQVSKSGALRFRENVLFQGRVATAIRQVCAGPNARITIVG